MLTRSKEWGEEIKKLPDKSAVTGQIKTQSAVCVHSRAPVGGQVVLCALQ